MAILFDNKFETRNTFKPSFFSKFQKYISFQWTSIYLFISNFLESIVFPYAMEGYFLNLLLYKNICSCKLEATNQESCIVQSLHAYLAKSFKLNNITSLKPRLPRVFLVVSLFQDNYWFSIEMG